MSRKPGAIHLDDMEDELSADEYELYADQLVDQASAAETIAEMETEICLPQGLEQQAQRLVASGSDLKWEHPTNSHFYKVGAVHVCQAGKKAFARITLKSE